MIKEAKLDQKLFTVYSSFSGAGRSNYHYIHSIKFHDFEDAIPSETAHTKFDGKNAANDILHIGNTEQRMDKESLSLALNKQLTRYNSVYSKLITQYEANVDTLNSVINAMPDEPYYAKLTSDIS